MNSSSLPILYKKSSTGAILEWTIGVIEDSDHSTAYQIVTIHGQVGGKLQTTSDTVWSGKNIGKKNETSIKQQAELEAKAKHNKQLKEGYVTSIKAAEAGELDAIIEGGIEPILAFDYMDVIYNMRPGHENDPPKLVKTNHAKKIKFPVYVQPKLDGIRSTAAADENRTLWSRTRKPIESMPHIQSELVALMNGKPEINDGELYNHEFKNDFEKIVSVVRKDEAEDGYLKVQYHMYDIVMEGGFEARYQYLSGLINSYEKENGQLKYIRLVETVLVHNEDELMEVFKRFRKLGYEGAMLRNADGKYVNKRSYDLQKFKDFMEDDFEILDIEEGSGKLQGHVGAFVLKLKAPNTTKNGTVSVKLGGDTGFLKECFENHALWKGKKLTVVYQGYTVEKSLRFPTGKAIRDYE